MNDTHNTWTDEELMTWADGEMSDARMAELEAAMNRDTALADRAALMLETRLMAKDTWNAELDNTPVPDALRASVEAMVARDRAEREAQAQPKPAAVAHAMPAALADAVPAALPAAPAQPAAPSSDAMPPAVVRRQATSISPHPSLLQRAQNWLGSLFGPWPAAVAISALCAGLGFMLGSANHDGAGQGASHMASAPAVSVGQTLSPDMAQALAQVASGDSRSVAGGELVPVATYTTETGGLCREFSWAAPQQTRLESVACQSPEQPNWQVHVAAQVLDEAGFEAAEAHSALAPVLGQLGAGEALSPEAEQAALARLR